MSAKFLHTLTIPILRTHQITPYIIIHCLRISNSVLQLKQTHSLLLKTLTTPSFIHLSLSRLLTRLLQFPSDNLSYAHHLFDQIPNCKNQFIWTSLIRSHVIHCHFPQSISLYAKMHQDGVFPSGFTFSSVLSACARIPALFEGKQVHAMVVRIGYLGNKIVETTLLDMYAKCGLLLDARDVFEMIDDKDTVSWTAMICGYTKKGLMDEARRLFDNMGKRNPVSWSTMVAGYANWGDMEAAKELYNVMPERNSVSWVAMIAGYGKCGDVVEARKIFDGIVVMDVSCWAAMVACYAQNGYSKEAIGTYNEMREQNVGASEVAMVGAISACTQLGDVEMANTLWDHVQEGCCDRTIFVSNALIYMHSKCGNIDQAREEFNRMIDKDVISYSALITALADHGKAKEALELFSKMQEEGIKPNQVSFIGILNACSHAGLIEEGCKYFLLMTKVYGIKPLKEHYACMVDLLGRSGQVEKAYKLIIENVDVRDAKIWGSLLGACKVYGNVELGEIAAKNLHELEPENTGNLVLLANTYASIRNWEDAERVKIMMTERGMSKSPGCSWITGAT